MVRVLGMSLNDQQFHVLDTVLFGLAAFSGGKSSLVPNLPDLFNAHACEKIGETGDEAR